MLFNKITLAAGSPPPVETAARELSGATGATVERRPADGKLGKGEITLVLGEAALGYEPVKRLTGGRLPEESEWEIVAGGGDGLVIAGSSGRNLCHATLAWLSDPGGETDRISTFRFRERFSLWDNTLNQWHRDSRGFDRASHFRELALRGFTGAEVNRYADAGGWHVRNRRFPGDSYAWYLSYAPALDAFVESSLTAGLYPHEELQRNLATLLEAASLARSYGLAPGFVCYEPRCVNEVFFERQPQLRGARTDHPGRSLQPRYTLDIAHPWVLEHYAELLGRLMAHLPDLRYLVYWTGDSGSGLPFATFLYPGPNGSYLAKSKTLQEVNAGFARALAETGRKINTEFEVLMEIGWEYTDREREALVAALPEGVGVTHPLGAESTWQVEERRIKCYGGFISDRQPGLTKNFIEYDRSVGREPYGEIFLSSWWDWEPLFGIPFPSAVADKFQVLNELDLEKLFIRGGVLEAPQCPWSINQEIASQLIRRHGGFNLEEFLARKAIEWCGGSEPAAALLMQAWRSGDRAQENYPVLSWFMKGGATTQARWLTRPLVPDATRLSASENAAWTRALFTLEWDVARVNLAFEGGLRIFTEEDMEWAVGVFDRRTLPLLAEAVKLCERAWEISRAPVLTDQRDRYLGLTLWMRTIRNSFAVQAAINRYLLADDKPSQERYRLMEAIRAEIANTRDWIEHLETSRTNFFRVTDGEETPFLYKTPLEDMKIRLAAMERHIEDEPGPDLPELRSAGGHDSAWREDYLSSS